MLRTIIAATSALFLTSAAHAELMNMTIELSGAQEVPPVETAGAGTADLRFDSDELELSWTIQYGGLTGPATAAHIHGPADMGENAGVVVPLMLEAEGNIIGSAQLTPELAEALAAGQLYFNIHTEQNPNGEIRGQIVEAM